jgi:small conductance mechanosensitive channel
MYKNTKGLLIMTEFLNSILQWITTSGIRLVLTLLIAFICWKVAGALIKKFEKSEKGNLEPTTRKFLAIAMNVCVKIVIIVCAISTIGVNTSAIVTVLATAGATVGLALQGGLSNLAGGVILVIMHPFKIGDYITGGGQSGTVQEIGLFYTTLLTPDNQKVFIPNGALTSSSIVNVSAEATRRVDMPFSVAHETDIKRAKLILTKLAKADDRVLDDPAPAVVITEYNNDAIKLTLRVWCAKENYWGIFFDMQETVKEAFDLSGIVMPKGQLDVHIKESTEE